VQTRHELAEIARGAAHLIGQRGLQKRNYVDIESGAICLQGALALAIEEITHLDPLRIIIDQRNTFLRLDQACVSLLRREGHGDILRGGLITPRWNDLPETTAEDVILLLKKVAEELETT